MSTFVLAAIMTHDRKSIPGNELLLKMLADLQPASIEKDSLGHWDGHCLQFQVAPGHTMEDCIKELSEMCEGTDFEVHLL